MIDNKLCYPPADQYRRCCEKGQAAMLDFRRKDFPDPWGWRYGKALPPCYGAFGRLRLLLTIAMVEKLNPATVLEVAAGGGGLAAYNAQRKRRVVANDLRGDALAASLAEFGAGDQVEVAAGDIFGLTPEQLGTFDLVIACELIEHCAHPDQLLTKLKQFLAPGGHLLLTTPNGAYAHNKLPTWSDISNPALLESVQFKPDADGHLFLLTPAELANISRSAGLTPQSIHVWGTPFITGHLGFNKMLFWLPFEAALGIESLIANGPRAVADKACFSMLGVLR